MRNPIIVALDVADEAKAIALAAQVAPYVGAFKVGKELFVSAGPDFIRRLRQTGAAVFLDLKFHDIPNTVAKAVAAATRLDVQMLTVHTSGGSEMMRAAERAAQTTADELGRPAPPLVLGVTVLTSLDSAALGELGGDTDVTRQVERLARLAATAGLRGLVCSPLELAALKKILPPSVQLVTPGIRSGHEKADDQKRTLSPKDALAAGASWLVIGRPIIAAADPAAAAQSILASLPVTVPPVTPGLRRLVEQLKADPGTHVAHHVHGHPPTTPASTSLPTTASTSPIGQPEELKRKTH
jgi:orotidine-5'-phosphate decarboxylase